MDVDWRKEKTQAGVCDDASQVLDNEVLWFAGNSTLGWWMECQSQPFSLGKQEPDSWAARVIECSSITWEGEDIPSTRRSNSIWPFKSTTSCCGCNGGCNRKLYVQWIHTLSRLSGMSHVWTFLNLISFLFFWQKLSSHFQAVYQLFKAHKVPFFGLFKWCRAVADYHSPSLPFKLSANDICITVGCSQAIQLCIAALATPGANMLLPRPGFPIYETFCKYYGVQCRYYDLIPDKDWEIDLDEVTILMDANTVAWIVCNPSNPCGSVYKYQHLAKVCWDSSHLPSLHSIVLVYEYMTQIEKYDPAIF